uniref:RING-type E3 ubiquitin transferase n=1 Tax=Pavo cristatus TaxID=9049 RepID=A0A8C9L763_PAVCR
MGAVRGGRGPSGVARVGGEPSRSQRGACAASGHPQCAICLQAYKPHEALKLLSCSHAYHSNCIDLWHCTQPGSKTCPLCRRKVTAVALIPLHAHNSEEN